MAVLRFLNGKTEEVPAIEGEAIWDTLQGNGEEYPDLIQEKAGRVTKVWLNWRNGTTPESFIEAYKAVITQKAVAEWLVDRNGRPTRPDARDKHSMDFAVRYGLVDNNGNPTWEAMGGKPL